MRPLSITLEGFRSHAQRSVFDLRGRRLVGIVGPIGSGKSSILDAVVFALYGMTPTERSNTKSLIHQRADAARVELVFEVEGQVWRAVRALRRAGQSEHALFRFPSDEALRSGDDPLETVLKKGEVDQRVEQLLGLDFAAFNRSVLLAQGRFAELLRATATQRDEVLKGVFGFDRVGVMERLAKLRRDTAIRDLEELGRERDTLTEVRHKLETARKESLEASARRDALAGIEADLAAASRRSADARTSRAVAVEKLEDLRGLAERMPSPEVSSSVLGAASEASEIESALGENARLAREEAQTTANTVVQILEEVGGDEALAEAASLVAAMSAQRNALAETERRASRAAADHSALGERLAELQARRSDASGAEADATRTLQVAEDTLSKAEQERHRALHADMAATLQAGLRPGDPCPVCEQKVETVPNRESVDLAATEAALESARVEVRAARQAAQESAKNLAAIRKEVEGAEEAEQRLAAAVESEKQAVRAAAETLAETERAVAELLGTADAEQVLRRRQSALSETRAAADRAARRADEAQHKLDGHRRASVATSRALEELAAQVNGVAARLRLDVHAGHRPGEVAAALEEVRESWAEAQQQVTSEVKLADQEIEDAAEAAAKLLRSVGLEEGADFAHELAAAEAKHAALAREIEMHEERLDASADVADRIAEAEARAALYRGLASELTPSRFLNFLLREERAVLSDLGSHRFEELTGGRYRFTDDGEFDVVDLTAAEQVRKADSLSGGETFLASLALALALAEMVTRGGGRLDAFFLDEGFGSLDAEHLDLAMAGVERLVTDHEDRLVVIVSHVPELRQRLEELIVLDKDPGTGATVVLSTP